MSFLFASAVSTNLVESVLRQPTALQMIAAGPEATDGAVIQQTVEASGGWLAALTERIDQIDAFVWGVPLVVAILVTGILLTLFLRFNHLFNLKRAFRYMFHTEEGTHGEVSSFGALCTALSATIGTGNIVGVATAIGMGGPGALFWMEVAAFFGMATKYAEGLLAVKYREITPEGRVLGGPFYYIERGLKGRFGLKSWKWLAVMFAFFGVLAGLLGIGTITQVHGISSATQRFFDPQFGYHCHEEGCTHKLALGDQKGTVGDPKTLSVSDYLKSYGLTAVLRQEAGHLVANGEESFVLTDADGNERYRMTPVWDVEATSAVMKIVPIDETVVSAAKDRPSEELACVWLKDGACDNPDPEAGPVSLSELTLTCPEHRALPGVLSIDGFHAFGVWYSYATVIAGLVVTLCVALVVIGGLKRIAAVSTIVVPFMAISYILICAFILLGNAAELTKAIQLIIRAAFNPAAFTGGVCGSIFIAMQKGIARGIFSNEAGLGSAPIAAAAARTNEPARQGLVCMTGTYIDTIIVCTMTGLAIVVTGAWEPRHGLEGVDITIEAFRSGLAFIGPHSGSIASCFLMVALTFFAFTTILGWDYYSEKCLEYLVGPSRRRIVLGYRCLYVLFVFIGPYLTLSAVWGVADVFNGLMALPNLIALILLSPVVWRTTKDFLRRNPKL